MGYLINILETNNIPYIIIKKKYKRVSAKYNVNSVLEIRQPRNFPDIEIIKFIEKNIDWIIEHKPNKPLPHDSYCDNDSYFLLGQEYIIRIVYSNYETVLLRDNIIFIHTANDKHIPKLLDKFRYEQAEIVFNEILYRSFISMQEHLVKYPSLTIKTSKSRWGCCYTNENRIMLNIALIHVPFTLIEYVIFHELVHFVYPNHSRDFHDLLKKYVYDERVKHKQLKNYCIIYK